MAAPFKKPEDRCRNRFEIMINDSLDDWFIQESEKRGLAKSTLGRMCLLEGMKKYKQTLADKNT